MKFIAGLLLGMLLGMTVRGGLVCSARGRPIAAMQGFVEMLCYKQKLATSIFAPKILFVGGSSVDLGISAGQASKETRIPCLNYGFIVPLGLDYILHLTQNVAKPGDTVVLALEYNLYDWPGVLKVWLDPAYIEYISSRDDAFLRSLPLSSQMQILARVSDKQILAARFRPSGKCSSTTCVTDSSFRNSFGDRTDNTRKMRPLQSLERNRPLQILETGFSAQPKGFPAIRNFCEWAKAQHIQVIATFPNIATNSTYRDELLAVTERRIRKFYEGIGVPVVGSIQQAMFPESDCYDTVYHLVDDAVARRTSMLVDAMRPVLTPHATEKARPSE
jgi:hypothetical protein